MYMYERLGITCTCTFVVHVHVHSYMYLTVIVVHEMHGRMHHNHCQITILLDHDPLSSLAYPMMTHPLPLGNCQQIHLLYMYMHVHIYMYMYLHVHVKCTTCMYM